MRKKFCPKCGKATEKFYDNLCSECFLEKISFKDLIPDKISIKVCKYCGRVLWRNKYFNRVNDAVEEILSRLFKKDEIKEVFYEILDGKVSVKIWIRIDDLEKQEEKVSKLAIKSITCKFCFMKSTGYYQAILQVRASKDISSKILKEVEKQINILNKTDELAFISKVEELKNGFNIFIGSKKAALALVKILRKKFDGKIKISRKLGSIKKGKKLYRYTILLSMGE